MSIKVMTRVWEFAQYKDSTLLVLLALADYADDNGVCWPSQPEIAKKARLSDRQVRNVLNQLVADGEVLMEPSKGRGHPARYCVLSGLSDSERDKRRQIFPGKYFLENKTRKLATENPEICDTKPGNLSHIKYPKNSATESAKPAQQKNDNRHEPSIEPSSSGDGGEKRKETPRHVSYLLDQNMGAANEFADLDPDTAIRDFDARVKAGQSRAHIVRAWRTKRPTPDNYFGKPSKQESTGPPAPKTDTVSSKRLAELTKEITL